MAKPFFINYSAIDVQKQYENPLISSKSVQASLMSINAIFHQFHVIRMDCPFAINTSQMLKIQQAKQKQNHKISKVLYKNWIG